MSTRTTQTMSRKKEPGVIALGYVVRPDAGDNAFSKALVTIESSPSFTERIPTCACAVAELRNGVCPK